MRTQPTAPNGFAAVTPEHDAQGITVEEFLNNLFEFERCDECGKDQDQHVAVIDPFGNWFAYCHTNYERMTLIEIANQVSHEYADETPARRAFWLKVRIEWMRQEGLMIEPNESRV